MTLDALSFNIFLVPISLLILVSNNYNVIIQEPCTKAITISLHSPFHINLSVELLNDDLRSLSEIIMKTKCTQHTDFSNFVLPMFQFLFNN